MTLREHLERFDPQRDNFAMGWHVDGGFFVEVGDMHFYTRADFDIAARWSRWLTGLCGVPTATPVRAAYAREAPNPPTDTNAGATAVSGPPASDDKAHAEAWSVWQVRLVAEIDMARAVDKSGVPRVHAAVMKWLRRMPPLPVADLYDPYDTQKTPKLDPDLGEGQRIARQWGGGTTVAELSAAIDEALSAARPCYICGEDPAKREFCSRCRQETT